MNKDDKLPEFNFTDQEADQALNGLREQLGGFGGIELDMKAHETRGLPMDFFVEEIPEVVETKRLLGEMQCSRDILANPHFFDFALNKRLGVKQKVYIAPKVNIAEQLGLIWETRRRITKNPDTLLSDLGRGRGHVLWKDFSADAIPVEEVPGLERAMQYGCVHTYILRKGKSGKAIDENRVAIILPKNRVSKE